MDQEIGVLISDAILSTFSVETNLNKKDMQFVYQIFLFYLSGNNELTINKSFEKPLKRDVPPFLPSIMEIHDLIGHFSTSEIPH